MAWLAGLAVAGIDEVTCTFDYPDDDSVLDPLLKSGIGRAAARLAGPDAVDKALREALRPYRTARGGYRLENLFRVLVAHAP